MRLVVVPVCTSAPKLMFVSNTGAPNLNFAAPEMISAPNYGADSA
jgi:hypothetical protein